MAMKMDVWQWGDVKGVDEELCNNLALFAEDNKIDYMNMTEKEFVDLKDKYLTTNYGNKGVFSKKSLKESKKFHYGEEIIKFLDKYGYNKRGEDFEQEKDYATVTYMYAIPQGMRPQTPYVEFTVDADNDAFIFGEFFTDGRKGYSTEFDSVEDLEYFISNANYSNVDLTENKLKEGKDSAFYDGIAKEFHFSKDEKNRYKDKTYISAIAVLFDRINNAIKTYGRNSDEEYNALNDCWEVISSAKQNGFNVDYDEDRWNKIAGLPNYH